MATKPKKKPSKKAPVKPVVKKTAKKTPLKKPSVKKAAKKPVSTKPAKSSKKAASADKLPSDGGIVIVEDDIAFDREKDNEMRKAYLEEHRSQEASD